LLGAAFALCPVSRALDAILAAGPEWPHRWSGSRRGPPCRGGLLSRRVQLAFGARSRRI